MKTSITFSEIKSKPAGKFKTSLSRSVQLQWQRTILLIVLAYEAVGGLVGGALLIALPDGSMMAMPVEILHGVFADFLIPGIILFGLGVLNAVASISVLRKTRADWIWASLAMGGFLIWFLVEIAILKETHWLHFMWGFPVIVGALMTLTLVPLPQETIRKSLLACGIAASLLYVIANVVTVFIYKDYNPWSQTVSELSAIGTPSRSRWLLLMVVYSLLLIFFTWGMWLSTAGNRLLRIAAFLLFFYTIIGFFWPPMHQREVLATGGASLTDSLHIAFTIATVILMLLAIGLTAKASGKAFGRYSMVTLLVLIVFGVLTALEAPAIQTNQPTPFAGVWERINIAAFLIWMIVLAVMLMKDKKEKLTEK